MRKVLLALAVAILFVFPSIILADNKGGFMSGNTSATSSTQSTGGFTGPNGTVVTVAEAMNLNDDTPVTLVGRIEKQVGGDKYLFRDDSGTITIEIDDDDWGGLTVGPDDMVEIYGEIDKGLTNIEIDVDRIAKR